MKKEETYYASTGWAVIDVLQCAEEYDIKITKKQAEHLLKKNEDVIVESMIATGWDAIYFLLLEFESRRKK